MQPKHAPPKPQQDPRWPARGPFSSRGATMAGTPGAFCADQARLRQIQIALAKLTLCTALVITRRVYCSAGFLERPQLPLIPLVVGSPPSQTSELAVKVLKPLQTKLCGGVEKIHKNLLSEIGRFMNIIATGFALKCTSALIPNCPQAYE